MMICYLWDENSPFPLKKYCFRETINIILMHLLVPFITENFFKNLELLPPLSEAVHRALSELKKNL